MRALFKMYQTALSRRPILMQAIQTGALMATGDVIAQKFLENKSNSEFSLKRTMQFASIGFCVGGPALRFWYGLLNKYIGASGSKVVLTKVFIDQVIFAPTFLAILLATVGTMQGKDFKNIQLELKRDYLDVLIANYYLWPWVQLVNFYFVPLHYQVLLVQVVAVFWNTYLSWKTNRQIIEPKEKLLN